MRSSIPSWTVIQKPYLTPLINDRGQLWGGKMHETFSSIPNGKTCFGAYCNKRNIAPRRYGSKASAEFFMKKTIINIPAFLQKIIHLILPQTSLDHRFLDINRDLKLFCIAHTNEFVNVYNQHTL